MLAVHRQFGKDLTIVIPVDDDIRASKVDDLTFEEFSHAYNKLLKALGL